ncbi:hypothetical protein CONLIGDRAFT_649857 [Coniochaeta ligniaria NRRL 30616]|uniref:Uncharacterized protein n=1 Tax=Coniochaeta ligniaria NRRL 30616 TaxID=1408157 RepID=A0A1J7I766_9PEZI|nr:hypothetical protein CONLIGDRAFT_649857 [Coniochaeta ligniaria NRRL 30616]
MSSPTSTLYLAGFEYHEVREPDCDFINPATFLSSPQVKIHQTFNSNNIRSRSTSNLDRRESTPTRNPVIMPDQPSDQPASLSDRQYLIHPRPEKLEGNLSTIRQLDESVASLPSKVDWNPQ